MHSRRRLAILLAAILAGAACVGMAAVLRDAPDPPAAMPAPADTFRPPATQNAPPPTPETPATRSPSIAEDDPTSTAESDHPAPDTSEPMLVGFMDDASFRWHPARAQMLDRARATGARLIRAFVRWDVAAPKRPAPGRRPFVAPRLHELDELVAGAEARGMEVLFTIWGTPAWANDGHGPNRAPTDVSDLRRFAGGLAARYPSVRRYSIWNEPNTNLFLTPQFDAAGRSVAPRVYASLYRAAYQGIKAATPDALVAIGETGSHGRDAPSPGPAQDRHSPARFAQLLSQERPRVEFDAWAHHPYPVSPSAPPDGDANWPNVTLPSLERFGRALDAWFEREATPLWVTELGYETSPAEPRGVTEDVQAEYAEQAIELAAAVPQVDVFVWFTFADSEHNTWQSGLLDGADEKRPAYESFAAAVRAFAAS
jgi:hypothetical protein